MKDNLSVGDTEQMQRPQINVGLLTYNYGRFLPAAIESVLAQTCADWQMVVCDDASTDGSADIVRPYLTDGRIRYVRHARNLGQADNWAFAMRQGAGPVVAVLHGDDRWLPGTLATVARAFAAHADLDLFFGAWLRDGGVGTPHHLIAAPPPCNTTGKQFFGAVVRCNPVLPSAAFLSRRLVAIAGDPDSSFRMLVDREYFLRAALLARRVCSTIDSLCVYQVHPASTTSHCNRDGTTLEETGRLATRAHDVFRPLGASKQDVDTLCRGLSRSVFDAGLLGLLNGHESTLMHSAVRSSPTMLFRPRYALDWGLSWCGTAGRRLLRRLHHRRLGSAADVSMPSPP